ncbi:MAG: CPBP family intramembrane glutamic endopeptidase [Bacteroidales bacterium]
MHPIVLSILVVTFCYSLYYFLFYKNTFWERWLGADESKYTRVCLMRIAGFFIFLLPYLLTSDTTPAPPTQLKGLFLSVSISVCILLLVLMNFFAARSPQNLAMYPQIRLKHWKFSDILISSFTWILYLIGYEHLFRGYLFFTSLQHFDIVSAIGLNVALYMLVHIPKGYKETFGSIPMGIVLCLFAYYTGNVWIPIILHSTLALSNEWLSIYFLSRQAKQF